MTDPINFSKWTRTFEHSLVASSNQDPGDPGVVHVVRALPAQLDPVPTGGLDVHRVTLATALGTSRIVAVGRPPLFDGPVQPGDLTVVPPAVSGGGLRTAWSAGNGFVSLMLPPGLLREACADVGLDYDATPFLERYGARDPLLAALAAELGREAETGSPGGRPYADQLLATAAAHLVARHTGPRPAAPPAGALSPDRVRRVRDLVRARLADPDLALADLAREAFLSEYHFARQFKRATGETPAAHVRRVRMEYAARRLRSRPGLAVVAVAAEVGYRDPSAFARAFRAVVGASPTAVRGA